MKLKSGITYWAEANKPPPVYPRLAADQQCDVAVIGAGITGALVAHRLVESGLNVVVLDKRPAGTGSTSASTALLLYDTDTSISDLGRIHGKKSAIRAYTLGRRAIRQIGRIVRRFHLDCDFKPKKSLYVASDRAGVKIIRTEYRHRRAAGFPCEFLNRKQLKRQFGWDFSAAIYSSGCAEVDAMRLAQLLLARDVKKKGLRVFQGARVRRVESTSDGVVLRTTNRRRIRARYVIVATGYEAAPFLKDGVVDLNSSYVIASQPQPPGSLWKDECLIWETARPYFYLRTTGDHRVLIGGEDEPFADPKRRDAKLPAKTRKLLKRFRALFPAIPFEVDYEWTGTFGETKDGLPLIGPKPGSPRILYALGYGGNGITFSQIAADLLERMCHGVTPKDAKLFRFDRCK